jgi:hypothetical protein
MNLFIVPIEPGTLFDSLRVIGEKRRWHLRYAKFNKELHQSLLAHCINVASVAYTLLKYIGEFDEIKASDDLTLKVVLTGFLHDVGKESEQYQAAVDLFLKDGRPNPLDLTHQGRVKTRPLLDAFLTELQIHAAEKGLNIEKQRLVDEIVWAIEMLGRREDAGAVSHSYEKPPTRDALLCQELAHLADVIASAHTPEECVSSASKAARDGIITSQLKFDYSKVSTIRGLLTQLLHRAVEELHLKSDYRAVYWFPEGTLYVYTDEHHPQALDGVSFKQAIRKSIEEFLRDVPPSALARASFGELNWKVISAPELLMTDERTIRSFWNYIFNMDFAQPNMREPIKSEADRKLYQLLEPKLKEIMHLDEETLHIQFGRFKADYNILVVLYGIRKQVVENSNKDVSQEATLELLNALADGLALNRDSLAEWPEIALQTPQPQKVRVALDLITNQNYSDPSNWRILVKETMIKATLNLRRLWIQNVSDRISEVAELLVGDLVRPVDPALLGIYLERYYQDVLKKGKTKGTPICPQCGGVADIEAQSKLFGASQTYHDLMDAGKRIDTNNKIRVCKLCDFEAKLRNLLLEGMDTVLILPHIGLSRRLIEEWQLKAERLTNGESTLPNILQLAQWADKILREGDQVFQQERPAITESQPGKFSKTILQEIAEEYSLPDDLSNLIDTPDIPVTSVDHLIKLLEQKQCKLLPEFQEKYNEKLVKLRPAYYSPNYILMIIGGAVSPKEEPRSATEIRLLFLRCIIARLFNATVLPEGEHTGLERKKGYTTLPTNLAIKSLAERLGSDEGWVTIVGLEKALYTLSALIALDEYLEKPERTYGRDSLIKLLKEPPGRVVAKVMQTREARSLPKIVGYLDAWVEGQSLR